MNWTLPYAKTKLSTVAIVAKFERQNSEFPGIIGTGFLVSSSGVVCTNRHVAEAIGDLPKPQDYSGSLACALLFVECPDRDGRLTWGFVCLEILAVGFATVFGETKGYLGPNPPDVAFLLLEATEMPALEISNDRLQEGEEVAFTGFPMGRSLLRAPGWLHQVTPTLHTGVVGAILPHNHVPKPHAFLVHANTQSGSSGSPVFRKDGKVVGIVYGTIFDEVQLEIKGQDPIPYRVPTSLTCCVSREILIEVHPEVERASLGYTERRPFREFLANGPLEIQPGDYILTPWKPPSE